MRFVSKEGAIEHIIKVSRKGDPLFRRHLEESIVQGIYKTTSNGVELIVRDMDLKNNRLRAAFEMNKEAYDRLPELAKNSYKVGNLAHSMALHIREKHSDYVKEEEDEYAVRFSLDLVIMETKEFNRILEDLNADYNENQRSNIDGRSFKGTPQVEGKTEGRRPGPHYSDPKEIRK